MQPLLDKKRIAENLAERLHDGSILMLLAAVLVLVASGILS